MWKSVGYSPRPINISISQLLELACRSAKSRFQHHHASFCADCHLRGVNRSCVVWSIVSDVKVDSYIFQRHHCPRWKLFLITAVYLPEVRAQKLRISIFYDSLTNSTHQIEKVVHIVHRQSSFEKAQISIQRIGLEVKTYK